jgi:ribose transport system ATP-binding protein
MKKEALKFVGVSSDDYSFGGLVDASFCLYEGETVALAGLFNSGRITLMRILSGDHPKYAGDIYVQGRAVTLDGYASVRSSKIAFLGDHRQLFMNMSLFDNVYSSQIGRRMFSRVRYDREDPETRRLKEALEIDLTKRSIDQLSAFEKMKLEILKSFIGGARIFGFANLTMYLREQEARQLAEIIGLLNQMGVAVIIDSDEYFPLFEEVVERCVVVRNGVVTTTLYKDENEIFDEDQMRHAIVGKAFDKREEPPGRDGSEAAGRVVLRAVSAGGRMRLEAREGDIIGVYDAKEALPKTLEGLMAAMGRDFCVNLGEDPFQPKKVEDLVRHGVAVITKEISDRPIFFNLSPVENVCLFAQKVFGQRFVYRRGTWEYLYKLVVEKHKILRHCVGLQKEKDCFGLSYEQQYELMIAKWLAFNPKIIVLYTPLSNVDTKNAERYKEWHMALSKEGKVQVLISSSYDSLEGVCTEIISI